MIYVSYHNWLKMEKQSFFVSLILIVMFLFVMYLCLNFYYFQGKRLMWRPVVTYNKVSWNLPSYSIDKLLETSYCSGMNVSTQFKVNYSSYVIKYCKSSTFIVTFICHYKDSFNDYSFPGYFLVELTDTHSVAVIPILFNN